MSDQQCRPVSVAADAGQHFESFHSSDACPVCVQDALHAYIKENLRSAPSAAGSKAGSSGSAGAAGVAPALPGAGASTADTGT